MCYNVIANKKKEIINYYGVNENDYELFIKCNYDDLALKIYMLVMCMLQFSNNFNF